MLKQEKPEVEGTPLVFHDSGPVLVPPGSVLEMPILVFGMRQPVGDLTVSLHVRHYAMGTLSIGLVSPDGRATSLSALGGGGATAFGESCARPLTFSDQATIGIDDAMPPHSGVYRPAGALATFRGLLPRGANGCWRLFIIDSASDGASALVACVRLNFRP